jgi:hypothetical protein
MRFDLAVRLGVYGATRAKDEADGATKRWNHQPLPVEAAFSPYTPYKQSRAGK